MNLLSNQGHMQTQRSQKKKTRINTHITISGLLEVIFRLINVSYQQSGFTRADLITFTCNKVALKSVFFVLDSFD